MKMDYKGTAKTVLKLVQKESPQLRDIVSHY